MASREVQVFDGDGVIPPELQKLMEENKQLRNRVDQLETDARTDNAIIARLHKDYEFLDKKLKSIGFIVAQEQPEEHYDKNGELIDEKEMRLMAMDPKLDVDDYLNARKNDHGYGYNHNS